MPIPSLPFDIVFEIVSHLEEEQEGKMSPKIRLQTEEGKEVSLVCRAWKGVGQALRWRSVEVPAAQLPSLVDHFTLHPHLVRHVRIMRFDGGGRANATASMVEGSEHSFQALSHFLPTLVNLQSFSVRGEMGRHLSQILSAFSLLQRLETMMVLEFSEFECSNDFLSSFQAGFNKLWSLNFCALSTAPSTTTSTPHSLIVSKKLPLERLKLSLSSQSSEHSQLANSFLSIVDPTNLWSVVLDLDTACMSSMQWLCGCPKLVELKVDISRLEDFSDFLPILHRLSTLKDFTLEWNGDVEPLPSPVPISTVIANYPSSLQAFKATQFVFFDLLKKFTKRKLPHGKDVAALKYIWVRTSELGTEGSSEEVVLWGEEHEGKVRWSCLEEEPDQEI